MSDKTKKNPSARKVYAFAALALILVVAAVSLGILNSLQSPVYVALSGIKETEVTFVISSSGNTTRTAVYENQNWTASYEPGKPLTLEESLYTTSVSGVTTLMNVVSNTTGFVFTGCSVSLPAYVPYAPDVSVASQKVRFTFQTPSTSYNGKLEFTVYYVLTAP